MSSNERATDFNFDAGLSFFGLGKLGLPLAALFAGSGLRTVAIDKDRSLIARLEGGVTPHAEPGLAELLAAARANISYTSDARKAATTDASIILVPTPSDASAPEFSSSFLEKACFDLAAALNTRLHKRYHLIVVSSTVYPGTMAGKIVPLLEGQLGQREGRDFGVVYVPDFVALGAVVEGFQHPSFVVIGSADNAAATHTEGLYRRIVAPGAPIRKMSFVDAELTKIAHNVFCCMKVSFGNFLAQLGDRAGGVDLDAISSTLALEPKIGPGYLRAGGPYGGPCLPRDTAALRHFAASVGLDAPLARAADEINASYYDLIERDVLATKPKSVAVLGLSFKTGSPVTTASPAFEIIRRLINRSIRVFVFDPLRQAIDETRLAFGGAVAYFDTAAAAVAEADTALVCNAEDCFENLASLIPQDRWIVDPWRCVRGEHSGLVQPGRTAPQNPSPERARNSTRARTA